jgi:3-phenylpropionate/cinnamic acid dioxygenase small subunit
MTTSAGPELQELIDREQIRELKARYWRFVDTEDWDRFRQVLADDVHFELPGGDPVEGSERFTAFVRTATEGCWKAHQGHMPELTFVSPTEAHGVWVLNDYKQWPSESASDERRGFRGYGHYRETYRKVGDDWKIAWLTVTYIRMDPLYPDPLPDTILGAPEIDLRGAPSRADEFDQAEERMIAQAPLQALVDREAIKQLKARYFESVDAQDWETFRALFADDARFELPNEAPIDGADAFVEFVRNGLSGARSVHHGHNVEIKLTGPTEACALWVLNDYVEWPPDPDTGVRRGMEGFSRYEETYRKLDGDWKIATWRLRYGRIDPLPREPLPDKFLGARAGLRADEDRAQSERARTGYQLFDRSSSSSDRGPAKPPDLIVQELLDREAIVQLKARYFRLVDARDWAGWRELFTDDCRIDLLPGVVIEGADNYVAAVREMVVNLISVHQGHMPIVMIDSPTNAHGTWSLFEYLEFDSDPQTRERRGRKGYGHERETYRKVNGQWKIASMHLSYLRMDPLPRKPLPERVLGRPSEHLELSLSAARRAQEHAAARS